MFQARGSGILMHITSLPSDYGIGDFGSSAYQFADFLNKAGQKYWQVLPLNPTDIESGRNSPYSSFSAFAGNTLLISPEMVRNEGFLTDKEISPLKDLPKRRIDFTAVTQEKRKLFDLAFERFLKLPEHLEYNHFCETNTHWLEDFAAFIAIKAHYGGEVWNKWPAKIRDRDKTALEKLKSELALEIKREKFLQFLVFKQWHSLKNYCNQKNIRIFGDLPIYVSFDSADVWTHPDLFKLDQKKNPTHVAGVPPDYFSETGQLWGNPVYKWEVHQKTEFEWWFRRFYHNFSLFDLIRVDHFRGFAGYWEVLASESTAINGKWIESPGSELFYLLSQKKSPLPIVAEDLGVITSDVFKLMKQFDFPGMKILMFAFDHSLPHNPYAPHNHIENCIVYTGTHDNNTVRGWFENDTSKEDKNRIFRYTGKTLNSEEIADEFVRLALTSVAKTVIIPIQDFLKLDESHRMNKPSTIDKNWIWRVLAEELSSELATEIFKRTQIVGRI